MNNNRNISWQYVNRSRCMICQSLSIRWISRDFKLFSSAPGSGPIPISPYFGPSEGLVNVFLRVYRNMNLGCSHRHLPTMHGIWIWIDMIWYDGHTMMYHDLLKIFFCPMGNPVLVQSYVGNDSLGSDFFSPLGWHDRFSPWKLQWKLVTIWLWLTEIAMENPWKIPKIAMEV